MILHFLMISGTCISTQFKDMSVSVSITVEQVSNNKIINLQASLHLLVCLPRCQPYRDASSLQCGSPILSTRYWNQVYNHISVCPSPKLK